MATRGAFVGPSRQQSFALQVGNWAEKARNNSELVTRKVVLEMVKRVVLRTPVSTGRARANWQTTIGAPASATLEAVDKAGSGAINRGVEIAGRFPMGSTIWISNGLPYASRLEYGWSQQAPAGMVRVTVAEFQGLVSALAGEVRQ